jgi:hypothetical protein
LLGIIKGRFETKIKVFSYYDGLVSIGVSSLVARLFYDVLLFPNSARRKSKPDGPRRASISVPPLFALRVAMLRFENQKNACSKDQFLENEQGFQSEQR